MSNTGGDLDLKNTLERQTVNDFFYQTPLFLQALRDRNHNVNTNNGNLSTFEQVCCLDILTRTQINKTGF